MKRFLKWLFGPIIRKAERDDLERKRDLEWEEERYNRRRIEIENETPMQRLERLVEECYNAFPHTVAGCGHYQTRLASAKADLAAAKIEERMERMEKLLKS